MDQNILQDLSSVLEARKGEDAQQSYVASLYARGTNKILEKVGEEATEVILAAKDLDAGANSERRTALAGEVADLWFHSMVMLAHLDMSANDVLDVLQARFGTSGHEEKASRS